MGFDLGSIGSLTKMFDPGSLVKQVVNSVLPKDMAVVGDVAGAAFDLNTGNVLGAAQLGMDAMKDLPQATKSLQQQQPQQRPGQNPADALPRGTFPMLEPPPPPPGKPIDMASLLDILKQLTALLSGAKSDSSKGGDGAPAGDTPSKLADTSSKTTSSSSSSIQPRTTTTTTTTTRTTEETTSGWRGSPVEAGATTEHATTSRWRGEPVEAGATTEHAATSRWRGEPPPPERSTTTQTTTAPATSSSTPAASATPASSAPASSPSAAPASSAPASSAPASSAPASSTSGASSAAPSSGETISSMAQLNTMSDSAIRDAVIHGRISPDLAKDQTAMMAIQQRMNAISEMNNLMTNMMRALHDMQMAVIQNIRA
jgi:hypothetical protein